MPPALAMAVATAPTTPWSGAVWSRMVMEYDDGVADMLLTLAGGQAPRDRRCQAQARPPAMNTTITPLVIPSAWVILLMEWAAK